MVKPSHQQSSSKFLPRRMVCRCLSRKSRKLSLNQDSSKHSMGTTNSQGRSPHSPFLPHSKIRSWHVLIVWLPPKPWRNMPQSLGVNLHMICSRRSHTWTQRRYNGNWDDWSKQRLCTNEDCHHKRLTSLSMR